eukprot:jgi/Picsp_1/4466/NSC_06687-R1_protein
MSSKREQKITKKSPGFHNELSENVVRQTAREDIPRYEANPHTVQRNSNLNAVLREKSPSEDVNVQLRKKELYKFKLGQAKVAYDKLFAVCQRLKKKVNELEKDNEALQTKHGDISVRKTDVVKRERTPHKDRSSDLGLERSTGKATQTPSSICSPTEVPHSAVRQLYLNFKDSEAEATEEEKFETVSRRIELLDGSPSEIKNAPDLRKKKSPAWVNVKKILTKRRVEDRDDTIMDNDVPFLRHKNDLDDFKYMEVVRKQDERKKLPAGYCIDCVRFYTAYGKYGSLEKANEVAMRLCGHGVHDETSKHRSKYQAPPTPPDFWDIDFLERHDS